MSSDNLDIVGLINTVDIPEVYKLLLSIAKSDPKQIQPVIPTLVSRLESADDIIVERSISILSVVAKSFPGDVATHIDDIIGLLTHDSESIRIPTVATCYFLSQDDPTHVKYYLAEIIELLDEPDRQARFFASGILREISEDYPQELKPYLDSVFELLDDDYDDVQHFAVRTLSLVAKKYPTAGRPAVDDIIPLIEDDNTGTHLSALVVVFKLATMFPEDITSAVAPLIRVLKYEGYPDKSHLAASQILSIVAREQAGAVEPFVDPLVAFIDNEPTEIRENVGYILAQVADEHPAALEPIVDDLLSLQHADVEAARTEALGIFTTVADREPGLLKGSIDAIIPALHATDPTTRQYAAFICFRIAEAAPTDAQAVISDLGDLMADDAAAIRKRAALAIAFVAADAPDAIAPIADQLHQQLDQEPDADIRSLIAGAVMHLEERQDVADTNSAITPSQPVAHPSAIAASFDDGPPPTDTPPSEGSPEIPPTAYIMELIDAIEHAIDSDDLTTCKMKLTILHDTMRETPIATAAYDTLLDELDDLLEHLAVRANKEQGLNDPLSTRIEELTHRVERVYGREL